MRKARWTARTAAAVVALVTAGSLAAVAAAGTRAAAAWTSKVVATGLDSPRGVTITPAGAVLVAEAGHGGDACWPAGPLGQECLGTTSQIASVDPASGAATPLAKGLLSESVTLEGITGADGVSAFGKRVLGTIAEAPQEFSHLTCDGQPADCTSVLAAAKAQAGQLFQVGSGGSMQPLAGLGERGYDLIASDSALGDLADGAHANPYGVLAIAGGAWVADSGANLIDWVPTGGAIDVASHVPDPAGPGFPADAVPTCVAMLRGNVFSADLAGRLWKRAGHGGSLVPTQVPVTDGSGKQLIHHVTGCASDGLDHLYLVDMWGTPGPPIPAGPDSAAGTGSVVELTRNGNATVLAAGLDFPNGIALAKDGSLYVTVGSTCTASGTPFPYCAKGGELLRLTP
jgi:hypothetical protein